MRKAIRILSFCLALLLPAAALAEASLQYNIALSGPDQLTVTLSVQGEQSGVYYHSAGGAEILSVTDGSGAAVPFTAQNGLVQVNAGDCTICYQVSLGALGKHGRQGQGSRGTWMASGAQVFLLPLGAYSVLEDEIASAVGSISVAGSITGPSLIENPGWADIYALLKSCMAQGEYLTEKVGNITVLSNSPLSAETVARLERIQQRLTAATGSFPEITVLFADPSQEVMGGAGSHAVGASFDPENDRDWELLTHRLFHVCFDAACPGYAVHMPGCLWLYEGLAVYHEAAWQEDFHSATQAMLSRLQARYEYCWTREDSLRIAPAVESGLDHAALEFLHYTQAPLIVHELLGGQDASLLVNAFRDAALALSPDQAESEAARQACQAVSGSDYLMYAAGLLPLKSLPRLTPEESKAAVADYLPVINSWLATDGKPLLQ